MRRNLRPPSPLSAQLVGQAHATSWHPPNSTIATYNVPVDFVLALLPGRNWRSDVYARPPASDSHGEHGTKHAPLVALQKCTRSIRSRRAAHLLCGLKRLVTIACEQDSGILCNQCPPQDSLSPNKSSADAGARSICADPHPRLLIGLDRAGVRIPRSSCLMRWLAP
ncbi:hypothetical protein OH76DRAFT_50504 [Lentinus brumalis]|uniref:Uncharacterized protein n=1 Tax=Lentinus brumalis TaxID=2498619 RepID=A0A371DYB7_9APHY|nr:hypothetical protein OH76DRAFT_50504 [Polyporus brumalis]